MAIFAATEPHLKEPTPGDLARHKRTLKKNRSAEFRVTRTIATVNRELSKLRRMLNIAQREGWIKQNPFSAGESLISIADERKRERILTRDEERRLARRARILFGGSILLCVPVGTSMIYFANFLVCSTMKMTHYQHTRTVFAFERNSDNLSRVRTIRAKFSQGEFLTRAQFSVSEKLT